MTPNMHLKVDPTTTIGNGRMLPTQKEPHTAHHSRKRKPAKCPCFANPIKLGVYLGLGVYALLHGAQQMLVHHHSSVHQHSGDNRDKHFGLLMNLPTLLFGPKYNPLAIMDASKQHFTNQDITRRKPKQADRQVRDAPIDGTPTSLPKETIPASATKNSTLESAIPKSEKVVKQDNSTSAKTPGSATTEAAMVDTKKEATRQPRAKPLVAKEKTKTVKLLPLTTSPKHPPKAKETIQTAKASVIRRKERPVESKSPMATREDWQKVMREQPLYPSIPSSPLNVGLITANGIKGPTQHVFLNGIYGSDYLKLEVLCDAKQHNCTSAVDYPNVDLWMIDANSAKGKPFPEDIVHQIVAIDNPSFRIIFVDYSDRLVLRKGFMDAIYFDIEEERMLAPHIRYALRCIDKYRRWLPAKGYVNSGRVVHPMWDEMLITKGGPPLHAPFAVRTDIADAIHKLLPSIAQGPKKDDGTSCSPLPYHPVDCISDRPMDLIHLWKVIETNNGLLRNLATESVETMRTWTHPAEKNRTLRLETAIQGNRAHTGRQSVSDDYVRTLLQTKIVVVTQRDGWEDHFRLFEALAAGTMVLMDEMVSLPHGLEDGESVVFFHSIQEMQDKAMYYLAHTEERLAIARKGWEVTMEQHRSWHRLEEMLFGRGLTKPMLNESWHFDS